MLGLKDKRVLITGGAGGIGKATARRFLDEGAEVVIMDQDTKACEQVQQEMPELTRIIPADVSNPDFVDLAFAELDTIWEGLDICINNAGISLRHSFLDITPAEWQQVIDINLNGVFYIAQSAARRMLAGGAGVIINMGSTNGLTGYPYYADYNASKAAVIELTRTP